MQVSPSMRRRTELGSRLVAAWRPTGPRLRGLVRSLGTTYLALGITLYILPGEQSGGPLPVVGLAIAVGAVGVLLRPLLLGLAVVLGSFGLLLIGVLTQAVILDVALAIAPDVEVGGTPEVVLVSWVAATIAALVNWLFDAGNQDSFLSQLLGRAVRVAHRQRRTGDPGGAGLLIVQLDGVGEDLLRQAITAGAVPTLSSWLRDGSHRLRGWHTGLPATTPAGQAVLLYGDTAQVPSFRWYEKDTGRLLVANHPKDAALIESRLSTGRGLLAAGGVGVSNLFSGDAPTTLLTMSDARLPPRSTRGLASFATARGGLVRSIVVFFGAVLTELYQGRRQRRRGVRPRVHRGGVFALLRGVTTALLRDLNVAIVAEQIARGTSVVFVDFLDYDEVAHHAGPSRPESMRTLDGLDRLIRFFAEVVTATDREYEIAIVSDHGQVQGATFEQLSGVSLQDVVSGLCDQGSTAAAENDSVERWGPLNLLLTGLARSQSLLSRLVNRDRSADPQVTLGDSGPAATSPLVVAASGSLAHLYLTEVPGRATRETIDERFPRLIAGLAAHPQVGVVLVRSALHGGLIAIGGSGWRLVSDGRTSGGEGTDPLAVYGDTAPADVGDLDRRCHVGDLVVLGRLDPLIGEVAAFEDLVGSHGGLGGGQTRAVLLHPSDWMVPDDGQLTGRQVHEVLLAHVPGGISLDLTADSLVQR